MDETKKLHIAMFPWLAFGHILPYLELAKLIAQKGHQISFISTLRNIQRLPKVPSSLTEKLNFVTLSLPYEQKLPENAEATMDIPYRNHHYLKKAYDGLQQPLTEFLQTSSPDWIIYDFSPHWLPPIAENLGISRVFFSIFNAYSLCFLSSPAEEATVDIQTRTKPEDFTVPPKWITFPTKIAFRLHEVKRIFEAIKENASGVSDSTRFLSAMKGCEVVAMRSCYELEKEWLNLFQEIHRKPLIPVGLLPPSILISGEETDENWSTIVEWLNKQKTESVTYIALGSEVTPSQDEFTELAHGLEESELPFFWVLRKTNGTENGDPVLLPEGFEERTKDRGIVWTSWAPQLRILSHDSVGGLLTHCGTSSIIEALHYGKALIMMPLVGDQGLTCRVFEEKKVGIEIGRNEEEGSLSRMSVAEAIRSLMVGEGRVCKEEAKKMSRMYADKQLHGEYVDNFVEYLENHGNNKM